MENGRATFNTVAADGLISMHMQAEKTRLGEPQCYQQVLSDEAIGFGFILWMNSSGLCPKGKKKN